MSALDDEIARIAEEDRKATALQEFTDAYGSGFLVVDFTEFPPVPDLLTLLDDFLPRLAPEAGRPSEWIPYLDGAPFVVDPVEVGAAEPRTFEQHQNRERTLGMLERRRAAAKGDARLMTFRVHAGDSRFDLTLVRLDDGPWTPANRAPSIWLGTVSFRNSWRLSGTDLQRAAREFAQYLYEVGKQSGEDFEVP